MACSLFELPDLGVSPLLSRTVDCATRPHNATVQREMLILNEKMPHSGAKSVKCVVGTQPSPPSGGTLINHVYPSKSLEKVIVIITA